MKRRAEILPPDFVMKNMKKLDTLFINRALVARKAGIARCTLYKHTHNPYMATPYTYNKLARLFKWAEWDDQARTQ